MSSGNVVHRIIVQFCISCVQGKGKKTSFMASRSEGDSVPNWCLLSLTYHFCHFHLWLSSKRCETFPMSPPKCGK